MTSNETAQASQYALWIRIRAYFTGVVRRDAAPRSLPIATLVSGMPTLGVLHQNINIARGFKPMSASEMQALRTRCAPMAADGRFELYKTSKKYEANEGRMQHGFPKKEELDT